MQQAAEIDIVWIDNLEEVIDELLACMHHEEEVIAGCGANEIQ